MKNKIRKSVIALLIIVAMLSLCGCGKSNIKETTVVIYTNDVHCGIGTISEDETSVVGGYAGLYELIKEYKEKYNKVIVVDSGDYSQGAPIGSLSNGQYIIGIMNKIGYNVAAIGNHEFDYGINGLKDLAKAANFPVIASNFKTASDETVFDSIYEQDGITFIGVSTPETLTAANPTYFQDENGKQAYTFGESDQDKFISDLQKLINQAKKKGNKVVILGHVGDNVESKPWESSYIISKLTGVDAWLDGHSHAEVSANIVKDKKGKEVLISQAGTGLINAGVLVFEPDGTITNSLVDVSAMADKEMSDYIISIYQQYSGTLKEVIAHTDYELTISGDDGKRAIRSKETNLGNLVADAFRTYTQADIAFENGGGIRVTIAEGDITYENCIKVCPFNNIVACVELTGQQILDGLEWGARNVGISENGGFLQPSGLSYVIDTSVPSGCIADENGSWKGHEGEYRVKDVKVGNEALDLGKTYVVAAPDFFLISCGDGFGMWGDKNVTVLNRYAIVDNQAVVNYLKNTLGGEVPAQYEQAQGRIKILTN